MVGHAIVVLNGCYCTIKMLTVMR